MSFNFHKLQRLFWARLTLPVWRPFAFAQYNTAQPTMQASQRLGQSCLPVIYKRKWHIFDFPRDLNGPGSL
jgi:hypothetical protein